MNRKPVKPYRIVKGQNAGFNDAAISIVRNEKCAQPNASAGLSVNDPILFVSKCQIKAKELFGEGLSLNTISTQYGVTFRFPNEKFNRKLARLLIKTVELEDQLRGMAGGINKKRTEL